MPYVLGIDIGSTNTAAAVARSHGTTWTRPEPVPLQVGSTLVPSVLCLSEDGSLHVGEPATDDGSRTTRDFVHRIGDDVPLLLGGETCAPQTLTAELAAWVVERVHALEGGPAEAIVLSHPAGWRPYRREVLHRALSGFGLRNVTLLPRTVTVAESHAARGFAGSTAVVYALGGNSFEAALVRRTPRGTYETFGTPQGLDPIGGADFDEALAEHTRTTLARELATSARRGTQAALRGLRAECDRVKRVLTVDLTADVVLALPGGPARIPVTRVQFEDMIRPTVQVTIDLLLRAVRSANLTPEQLDGVLLAGGSTRVPLVTELISAALPVPVEVEPDSQLTAATGAAMAACQVVSPRSRRQPPARDPSPVGGAGRASVPATRRPHHDTTVPGDPPPRPPVRVLPLDLPKPSRLALARSRGREG
ncbi:molecular chaperone DnaK (HSP70) [Micromonospora jinlongensis]|uniref:Molecular chaperone DnaK (HSP70) n=1 Tax=Micromonospora jinlongensis TaxID=1287877 RepID=A0A7Y9WY56_9ACTN|nr:Hsp70 family protein [Micromonospora jinlongensis]NYH41717.1 molecular chaperone DnaK (HSP70) [Micromonospora jinlongensis]